MIDEQAIEYMKDVFDGQSATELIAIFEEFTGEPAREFDVCALFSGAYNVPIRVLRNNILSRHMTSPDMGLSNAEFDEAMRPWLDEYAARV